MEINKVYNEPCLETLKKMPNESIDSVVTSPPYWQLRDYGYEGQWGLEPTYQE
jgi:DNA modification methylase